MNRKTMLLLVVAAVLITGSLFATDSRMTAMGKPFGYIRDNTDISVYPGAIHKYNRNVYGELGSSSSSKTTSPYWSLGANLPMMNNVMGIYLNTDTGVDLDDILDVSPPIDYWDDGYLDISKKIQFYFGFLEKFGVGFGMAIDSKKTDYANNPDKYHTLGASYFEVSGGMSTEMLDAGIKVRLAGANIESEADKSGGAFGGLGFLASGRYYLMDMDEFALMAVANLAYESGSVECDDDDGAAKAVTTYTTDSGNMMIDLGAGVNYKIADNHMIVVGFKPFRLASETTEYSVSGVTGSNKVTHSYTYIPEYNLGLESEIAPWLVGRVGARQNYAFYKYTNDPEGVNITENSSYESGFMMNLGLCFMFGNFNIDTVLSQSLLYDGPDFIGGKGNGLASQVSVNFNY